MKRTIGIICLIFMLFPFKGIAQEENYSQTFGKITQYEMSMTEYPKDKDAEALIIYQMGENYFYPDNNRGFVLRMKFTTKIKILKQAGIKYAEFEIPYYIGGGNDGIELVMDIQATTYNFENGQLKKTELQKSKIYEEKYKDDYRLKKFTMPDVREGSIIEVSYTIESPHIHRMREWEFQHKIPVVHSSLQYKAIPYYEYTYILKGTNKFDFFDSKINYNEIQFGRLSYKEVVYNFVKKDIPAFRDEEFITSPNDYMISMNFQLSKINYPTGGEKKYMTTWPQMCDDFLKYDSFGKYIKSSEKEAKKIIPTLDLEGKDDEQKIKVISNYVKSMYNWNGYYGKFAHSEKVSSFIKEKTGNAADINLFLIGLLKAANIEVNPVILSTRGNGLISGTHPFEAFFNYVIAEVNINDNKQYIDATESLLYYNELPSRCINVKGLVVKPKLNEGEWIFIEQSKVAQTDKKLTIKIDTSSLLLNVKAEFIAHGNDAYMNRARYISNKNDMSPYLKQRYNINHKGDVLIQNLEDKEKPFKYSFEFETAAEITPDKKIFIKPFCGLSIEDNPFKQTSRTLPIDLIFVIGDSYKTEIEIPEGYKVEHLPSKVDIDYKIMSLKYLAREEGNNVIIEANYLMNQNIYNANDYIKIKSIYTAMIDRFSEMIVLCKK